MTWGICEINSLPFSYYYGAIGFLGTFIVYNFQRLVKYRQVSDTSPHLSWVKAHHKLLNILVIIAALLTGYLFYLLIHPSLLTISFTAIAFALCIFYVVRIRGKNLREFPFIKIHLISLIWVFIISIFPLLNENNFTLNNWLFGAVHYFYLLGVCIPFDIRDLKYDSEKQKTIPQVIGTQSAKMIAILLLVTFTILGMFFKPELAMSNLFILAILIQVLLVYFTTKKRNDLYFGGFIDGAIVLLGVSYLFV